MLTHRRSPRNIIVLRAIRRLCGAELGRMLIE
jgi:hypothetical protein